MYQIRIYCKNDDKNCKKEVIYLLYGSYGTYEEACQAMKYLIDCYLIHSYSPPNILKW